MLPINNMQGLVGLFNKDTELSDGDMSFATNLLGQNQGSAPTPTSGGMFDAYSPQNQTNLQMAMLADIAGNVMGKDVGAMKTVMPYVENARKLRLQGVEAQQLQQMRESSQGLIDEYSSPQGGSGAAPSRSPLSRLQHAQLQNAKLSKDPGAVAKLLYEFGNRQYTRDAAQFRQLTPEEVSARGLDPNKQWQVDGRNKASQIGSGVNVETNLYPGGGKLNDKAAERLIDLEGDMDEASAGSSGKLSVHGNMLRMLEAKDPNDPDEYMTDFGSSDALTLDTRKLYNSFLRSFGGKEAVEALGLSTTTVQTIFTSQNKDLALLAAALMKGNLSEKELDFSVDLFSQISNTREANIVLTKLGMMRERLNIDLNSHMIEWRNKLDESNPNMGSDRMLRGFRAEVNKFRHDRALENDASVQLIYHDLGLMTEADMSEAAGDKLKARLKAEIATLGGGQ